MLCVTQRVVECNEAAERRAEDDRPLDPEHVAERPEIVRPMIERPPLTWTRFAATVSPLVVVDELSEIGQRCLDLLEGCVVHARATVDQDDRRPLTHRHPVGDELRPIYIDKQPNIADGDEHGRDANTGRPSHAGALLSGAP